MKPHLEAWLKSVTRSFNGKDYERVLLPARWPDSLEKRAKQTKTA